MLRLAAAGTRSGYAIVSAVELSGKREFHLDCFISPTHRGRDPTIDPCKQGVVSTETDEGKAIANSSPERP